MRYVSLVSRAYKIVIEHPGLWVLGLFMAAGFNINWLYLNTLTHSNTVDRLLRRVTTILQSVPPARIFLGVVIGVIILAVGSLIKIMFWHLGHSAVHSRAQELCDICHLRVDQPIAVIRLKTVFAPVAITSIVTVAVTSFLVLALYQLFIWYGVSSLSALVMLCAIVIAAVVALGSVFTILFIIIQRQRLGSAVRLTLDVLRSRWLQLIEVTLFIMLLYGIAVVIGSAIISLSQSGFTELFHALDKFIHFPRLVPATLASIATAVFWIWFAVTNACANLTLLLLFGQLVHPAATPEAELAAAKASAGV